MVAVRLAYEAHPSGQSPATFLANQVEASSVAFENPAHDFPQRVGYRLASPGRLTAWIEGTVGGRSRRVEFPYQRAECPH